MFGEVKNTVRLKFRKIYLYVFCCGNKDKMDKEIREREIKDEHDILWEKLEDRKF
jgi:hypothetical protein